MKEMNEIQQLKENFEPSIAGVHIKSLTRATVTVKPEAVTKIARFLFHDLKLRFVIATALETKEGVEILYHFSNDINGLVLNFRVILSKKNPEVETLTGLFEAANWIEREMHELFGINFKNHPNLEKLISDGNWAEGVYPYRSAE